MPVFVPEEERALFAARDYEMFRHVFDWLETITYRCQDLVLLGGASEVDPEHDRTPGAKFACFDTPLALSAADNDSCHALSFGVYDGLPLELALTVLNCHVYAVDSRYSRVSRPLPAQLHFYALRLHQVYAPAANDTTGGGDSGRQRPAQAPLESFVDALLPAGAPLAFLQMDVDGDEAGVLMQQLLDKGDGRLVVDRARQIAVTFHLSGDARHFKSLLTFDVYDTAFRRLAALGFRVAHSRCGGERRLLYPGVTRPVCGQYSVLLVKVGHDVWDRLERGNVPVRLEFMSHRFH